jgi:hypothetical protein
LPPVAAVPPFVTSPYIVAGTVPVQTDVGDTVRVPAFNASIVTGVPIVNDVEAQPYAVVDTTNDGDHDVKAVFVGAVISGVAFDTAAGAIDPFPALHVYVKPVACDVVADTVTLPPRGIVPLGLTVIADIVGTGRPVTVSVLLYVNVLVPLLSLTPRRKYTGTGLCTV